MRPADLPPTLTLAEAARVLRVTPKCLHERARLARRGTPRKSSLPTGRKVGARWLFDRDEVLVAAGLEAPTP